MSTIFTPPDVKINPTYIDGFENIVTKLPRAQTQSLAFVTLQSILLVEKLFGVPNVRLLLEYYGRTIGAAGNKNLRIQFDGTTIFDTGLVAISSGQFEGTTKITLDNSNNMLAISRIEAAGGSLGTPVTVNLIGNGSLIIDPNISHTLTIQALVANAADTFLLDWSGASIR